MLDADRPDPAAAEESPPPTASPSTGHPRRRRRPLSRRRRLLFACFALALALGVGLLLAEMAVRIVRPQDLSGTWREVGSGGYVLNRAGGTARHQFRDRVVHYRFNAHHMRGPEVPPEHGSAVRVLTLGDSYTFGWLLNEGDTYLSHLSRAADADFGAGRLLFLNGAAGGWGTADYVAYAEDFGPRLRPRVVIVFLGLDDVARTAASGLFTLSDRATPSVERRGGIVAPSRTKRLANAVPGYQFLLEHSHLVQLARKAALQSTSTSPTVAAGLPTTVPTAADREAVALTQALFRRLDAWCDSNGAELLVVTNWTDDPSQPPFVGGRSSSANRLFRAGAASFFRAEGIPYHDIGPDLLAAGGDLREEVIADDGHPNEAGAALVARCAWAWLGPELKRRSAKWW